MTASTSLADNKTPSSIHDLADAETQKGSEADAWQTSAPDGGLRAWCQCAGSFFILFNIWGLLNSFGVYQAFYETQYLRHESSSNLSWIGSLQGFLLLAVATITGPLFDRGYARSLVLTGSLLIVLGMAMTSLSNKYWQVMLAQGLCTGLGGGCLFVPSIAIIPTYFVKKRASAMGFATAGAGLGGVLYAILFYRLEPKIGFGWATRAVAVMVLVTQLIPLAAIKQRVKPSRVRRMIDSSALREPSFVMMGCSVFFAALGLFIPFFYVQVFAQQEHITKGPLGFYVLAILNAGSCVGRLLPNVIADKVGPLNVLIPCTFAASLLAYCWIAVDTTRGLLAFSVLYGLFAGSFISLGPTVIAATCPRLELIGTRLGMIFACLAIGLLIGNPIAGAIEKHGFLGLQVFCGTTVAISALLLLCVRAFIAGCSLRKKV